MKKKIAVALVILVVIGCWLGVWLSDFCLEVEGEATKGWPIADQPGKYHVETVQMHYKAQVNWWEGIFRGEVSLTEDGQQYVDKFRVDEGKKWYGHWRMKVPSEPENAHYVDFIFYKPVNLKRMALVHIVPIGSGLQPYAVLPGKLTAEEFGEAVEDWEQKVQIDFFRR